MKRTILICDICKAEQEEHTGHWSNHFDGPAIVSMARVKNNQLEYKWDILCYACSHAITDAVDRAIAHRTNPTTKGGAE